MKLHLSCCLGLAILLPTSAFAWGNDGHRIVGEIAWQEMTDHARSEARRLLPSGRFGTLYAAATWPDVYARQYARYDWVKPFHYVESDTATADVNAPADCDCVVRAIDKFGKQMIDSDETYYLRVNALRFLAHFVGDIHQPLHTGHSDGQGGNKTQVKFAGRWVNIHTLWDTTLIRTHLVKISLPPDDDLWELDVDFEDPGDGDWEAYAQDLLAEVSPADRQAWTQDLDPARWAEESFDLMKLHALSIADGEVLSSDYYDQSLPVISLRLKQAGIRLGALLNRLLDQ